MHRLEYSLPFLDFSIFIPGSNVDDSCRAMPICEDAVYTFPDLSSLITADKYDGNSTSHAWTIDVGTPQHTNNNGGEVALVLTETNNGTRISSTKYVHYGTITATAKTGRWAGVVAAFITMSNVKDEIDWEWPGANTTAAQSNFFFEGHVDCTSAHLPWLCSRHVTSI